jgi:DNA-binding MarR family transcriptional regulator
MSSTDPSGVPDLSKGYGAQQSIGYLLNRTADIIAATFVDVLREEDISLPEWRVLTVLTDRDGQTLSELAAHVGTELSYLSRVVSGAEERGLCVRAASPDDKRATGVWITAIGREIVQLFMPRAKALETRWLKGIPAADVQALRRTLHALYANVLSSHDEEQGAGRKVKVAKRVRARAAAPRKE